MNVGQTAGLGSVMQTLELGKTPIAAAYDQAPADRAALIAFLGSL
jgi:hypothetical protein